jgi:pilus assembly protein CpaC
VPIDRAGPPDEADLFLLGRTDSGVGVNPLDPTSPSPAGRPVGEMPQAAPLPPAGGMAALDPTKLEKDYGHAF